MSSPETEIRIPEWVEEAIKPLLTQTGTNYAAFQNRGEQAVGGTFWDDQGRQIEGISPQEQAALRIAQNLHASGREDIRAARRYSSEGARKSPLDILQEELLLGTGDQSNYGRVQNLLRRAGVIAGERPTGRNLGSDPALAEGRAQFELGIKPMLENQAALAGVGRGTGVMNAMAAGQGAYLLPMIQDALGREERSIDRRYADATGRANTFFGMDMSRAGQAGQAAGARRSALENAANFRLNLGETLRTRDQDRLNIYNQLGQERRSIRQDRLDSAFNERMRQLGAYEQATAGPLGMIPGVFGSRTEKW